MITEIFVENQRLDVSADISSLLTFALDDVKNFSSRQTTFSKTIVLPGTARNNLIFANVFSAGLTNNHDDTLPNIGFNFTPSKAASCIIFQDYLQTFKGTFRIMEIDIIKGRVEYQVAVNGNLTLLNATLATAYLTDLDFSEHNLIYSVDNISASWDNTPGSGVYFPMMDCGTYSTAKHDWNIRTFRPALYVKEYIDKIFAAAGFRYNCALFNSDRFKRLVIPHNQKDLTTLSTEQAHAYLTVAQNTPVDNTGAAYLAFDQLSATDWEFGTQFFNWGWTQLKYTGSDAEVVNISIKASLRFTPSPGDEYSGFVRLYSVPAAAPTTRTLLYQQTVLSPDDQPFPVTVDIELPNYTVQPGDMLYTEIDTLNPPDPNSVSMDVFSCSMDVMTPAPATVNINPGDMILLNSAIPVTILQQDFLVSIVELFNLYVYEDKYDERLINISPFVDFYAGGDGSVLDWTSKLDRSQNIALKPMSELTSINYNFNYAADSDYYNDLYQKRYNQVYGSYIFDSEFDFATADTQDNTLALIFASTPLVGYLGEDKIYPTIFKLSGTTEDRTDSVIRILQTRKVYDVASWNILNVTDDETTVLGTYDVYGYAGHFDDPYNPDNDLNFGGLYELFYQLKTGTLDRTQFNLYWSAYMAEITDKDSKLLSGSFYLRPLDIFNLDFSKFIYLDGVLWRLNKIADYNASLPATCTVELLRVINESYSYPIGTLPESERTLDYETGDNIEYSTGNALLYE